MFGKFFYYKFFLILKNIGLEGLNYRNTDINLNGELYLIKKLAIYFKAKNENTILFDVGANIGNYSKELNRYFTDYKTIYAFEPFSVPFNELTNLAKLYPMIKPYNIGFSDTCENKIFYSNENYSEIGGVYDRSIVLENIPQTIKETKQFSTLDFFCNENSIPHIHFLKIDVEGHEYMILKGANLLIQDNKIDFIQFEFGAGNHFSRTFFLDFFQLLSTNYKLFRILSDGIIEVVKYNSDLEIQVLSNYFAVNKLHANKFLSHVQHQ